MNKPSPAAADAPAEPSLMSVLAPMQETLDRLRKASERVSTIYADIATEQTAFLQRTIFDALFEMQSLSRVRGPAEFLEQSQEFSWKQAERSMKAFSEIGTEICSCWFDALKAAPDLAAAMPKGRKPN